MFSDFRNASWVDDNQTMKGFPDVIAMGVKVSMQKTAFCYVESGKPLSFANLFAVPFFARLGQNFAFGWSCVGYAWRMMKMGGMGSVGG